MPTIPQVAAAMQTVLTDVAERAGWQSGLVRRADAKLTGAVLTQTLVFGLAINPRASLSALTQMTAALGTVVTPEALHQRFTRAAASCLEQVLAAAVRQVVAADPIALPLLDRFAEVVVQDSSTIALPEDLVPCYHGCGNGHADRGNAALKLHVALDLRTGRLRGPTLHDGRESDKDATLDHDLPAGAVRLVDLGFWDLATMQRLQQRGVYWFSRGQAQTAIQTDDGRWWELRAVLEATPASRLDLAVRLGKDERVAARLLAVRAPQEVVDQRRRRLRADARAKGETVSAQRLELAAWTVFVTTIPADLLSLDEALVLSRARWQIELLFKLWKGHGQVDWVADVQPWRVLCELYGRLLGQIVQHWILLVSCWAYVDRSLPKAAATVQTHWMPLAVSLAQRVRLAEALTTVARCIAAGCRQDRRATHLNCSQRFEALAHYGDA